MAELLRMPEVAAGTESAVLSAWLVAEGSQYSARDILAVIETEKAVVDFEAESDGVLVRTLISGGSEVVSGTPIALIAGIGEKVTDIDDALAHLGAGRGTPAPEDAGSSRHESTTEPIASDFTSESARVYASPLARRMAKDAGLDVHQIHGTGPGGRIVRRDVEAALSLPPTDLQTPGAISAVVSESTGVFVPPTFIDVPHTRLRRAIASRLTESKLNAPHFYLSGRAIIDRLMAMREEINTGETSRVSVNDLVLKAVAKAHQLVPAMNVTWTADAIRHHSSVDVSVAIATENGLVTPVLRSVENMTVSSIASTVRDYAERARAGRLQQHELEGGSVTVTNLGMFGTEEFTAIINPPQASILAVGAAHRDVVVEGEQIALATVMRVTLSIDHRPVDGVVAALWMQQFLSLLENPSRILS